MENQNGQSTNDLSTTTVGVCAEGSGRGSEGDKRDSVEISVSLNPFDSTMMGTARECRNDEAVYRWCRQHKLISDIDQQAWFAKQNADPSIQHWSIGVQVDGSAKKFGGVVALTSINLINRNAEFSLYVAPVFHRKGVGIRALCLLLDRGFSDFGLNLIWGESFENNPAWRMFEKLGMKKEAVLRDRYFKEGKFISVGVFSITSQEWRLRKQRGMP